MTDVLRASGAASRPRVAGAPPAPRWRPAHLVVPAAAVVSVGGAVPFGAISVAVMALVLLGLVLARLVATPPRLATFSGAVLLAAAWASVFDLYARVVWLDVLVHAAATGALAAMGTGALLRAGVLTARGRAVPVVAALAVGLALGVLWELGEWAGHTYLDDGIGVGYDDTVGDLAAGGLGAGLAGLLLARPGRAGSER